MGIRNWLKYNAVDTTAMLSSTNPIYTSSEIFIAQMPVDVSIDSRFTIAGISYTFMGPMFARGRDFSRKKFGITNTLIKRGKRRYMKPIDECSLGQVLTELRRKKILSRIPKLKEEDVKPTEDLRNKIFHIALSTIPMKERKRKLSISQVCSANRVLIALEQHFTK